MEKKSRASRRREKLKRDTTPSLTYTIKPFLSFTHPVTRFCLLFLGLLVISSLLLYLEPVEAYFATPVTILIATHAAWILKLLGMNVTTSGTFISGEGFRVEILGNCNAIFETMLFLSAVIAFPARLREKIMGGVLGTTFIYILNLLRVVILFLVGVYTPQYFEESHVYVSQTIFIVMVAVVWLLWVGKGVSTSPAE